jgi:hypothetical protein
LPWCVRLEPNKPSAEPVGSAIVYQGSDLFWKVFGEKLSQISGRFQLSEVNFNNPLSAC